MLSTVAVNLKDCAPFASLHRPDLSGTQSNDWQRLFDAGTKAQADGDFPQAANDYSQAEQLDESFAELRFRRGQCALAMTDAGTAQKEFAAARDLDALRFRCDSRLNDIIRQQAAGDVTLADGEQALAEASPEGIPGGELFYEHVHLTFQGNYVLARALTEKVEEELTLPASAPWPDPAKCARRLGHTPRDTQLALSILVGRLGDIPFTFQANHDEQMRRLAETAHALPPADSAASLREAQSAAEAALARWPNDAELWEQLGEIEARKGDYAGGVTAVQHSLDLVPSRGPECWLLYGTLLAQEQKYEDAIAAFKQVNAFYSRADWAGLNLALCLERLGRRDEAVAAFKRVLALKPDYGAGWLALGQLYEQMGRTNAAEHCYTTAVTNRMDRADDRVAVARFCARRGWLGPAVTNYAAAIELSPSDPGLRMEAGQSLAASGRHDEAAQQYRTAVDLAPDQAQPHIKLGFELGRLGKSDLAEQEFRRVLQLDSNSIDARVALGVALYEQRKFDDARKQFEDVLRRNSTDATALQFVQLLRTPAPAAR
jgi:tetratricopeptide (TPR) repeat protein